MWLLTQTNRGNTCWQGKYGHGVAVQKLALVLDARPGAISHNNTSRALRSTSGNLRDQLILLLDPGLPLVASCCRMIPGSPPATSSASSNLFFGAETDDSRDLDGALHPGQATVFGHWILSWQDSID
jgi:hypothetical protein